MRLVALALALAACVGQHAPAAAQAKQQKGAALSNVPHWGRAKPTGQTTEIELPQVFAECVVTYWPKFGEALLATVPESEDERKAAERLTKDAGICLRRGADTLKAHQVRGAIAEVLLRSDGRPLSDIAAPFSPRETPASFVRKISAGNSKRASDADARTGAVARWAAYCAVRKNSSAVQSLLKTQAGSGEELASLDQLNQTLSGCLTGGQKLDATVRSIRAHLAEALYWHRLANGSAHAKS